MAKYDVWDVDAWLEDDGEDEIWEYNNRHKIATIELPSSDECDLSTQEIVNALYKAELITTNDGSKFDIQDYGAYPHPALALINYETGEPLFDIEFKEE